MGRGPPAKRVVEEKALLDQFDLVEAQFDRRRTPEDRDRNLDAVLVEIEFLDNAVERGKRPRVDLDRIADLVIDSDLTGRFCCACSRAPK
jgi:hypothetical protein